MSNGNDGLSDPEVRRKIAELVVWGNQPHLMSRNVIQKRLENLLERLAKQARPAIETNLATQKGNDYAEKV